MECLLHGRMRRESAGISRLDANQANIASRTCSMAPRFFIARCINLLGAYTISTSMSTHVDVIADSFCRKIIGRTVIKRELRLFMLDEWGAAISQGPAGTLSRLRKCLSTVASNSCFIWDQKRLPEAPPKRRGKRLFMSGGVRTPYGGSKDLTMDLGALLSSLSGILTERRGCTRRCNLIMGLGQRSIEQTQQQLASWGILMERAA
jgi:hypothetical protein